MMSARSTGRLLALAILLVAAACSSKTHLECPKGETACNGACVSLLTDPANCGACGAKVGALQACVAGLAACAPGVTSCGGTCVDLVRDPAHCGACDTACGAADLCATDAGVSTCTATCPGGTTACGGACVALDSDRLNCGACGHPCAGATSCRAGACVADVVVACYASSDVRPVSADLASVGTPRAIQGSPTVLATAGAYVYTGNGFPGSVAAIPLDAGRATNLFTLTGNDVEGLTAWGGVVLASNAATHTLVAVDPVKGVLDEWTMPGDQANPHGIAVVGTTAYVALSGLSLDATTVTGQAVAKVDLSRVPACVAGTTADCGSVLGSIDLRAVAGAADTGAFPFPSKLAVRGDKVYVTLANLKYGDCGGFSSHCVPAGHGKLAVIDTATDAVSIVDLGADCGNPGDLEIAGNTAWVVCGSFTFSTEAPGAVIPVDLSGAAPVVGSTVDASSIVPGAIAVCGGKGYLGDQASGTVVRFDLATKALDATADVCPVVFFAWAADLACPAE
jgi:stigma-specific protein Stig1